MPDFAAPIITPEYYVLSKDSEDSDAKIIAEFCEKAFYSGVSILVPKLRAAYELDDDIARFFEYCHRTYRDGAALYRQISIDYPNRREDLELAGSCLFPSEALLAHQVECADIQKEHTLKEF